MQQPHRDGRTLQCRKEEGRVLLLHADLFLSMQMSFVRRLVRDSDGSQGQTPGFRRRAPMSHISLPRQNTRYVVVSGARQKDEEWNPEENGGFAIHGTWISP